jgi:hypothetical protein
MNTLYLLGGPTRTAKTTIMTGLAAKKGIQFIAADAVGHGVRNLLTGEPHQMLRDIEIHGSATRKKGMMSNAPGEKIAFSKKLTESEMSFQTIIGMLDYYGRSNESVAFEAGFSPDWVSGLKLDYFTIRAAFVGYTDPSHADSVLAHAKAHPHDWVNEWLHHDKGDETRIREWVARHIEGCKQLKAEAEQHGYPFFDISTQPFEDYVTAVQAYLLDAG